MSEAKLLDRAELTRQAAECFARIGLDEPRREAARLWRELMRDPGNGFGPEMVGSKTAAGYLAAVQRRVGGEPFGYVVGAIGFRHLTLATDSRALIPRPETEQLVELALGRVRHGRAADIGTGTGAIALSLAYEGEFEVVFGVDLSQGAVALARENGRRTGVAVTWLEGDLVEPLAGQRVDLIVANPPYLTWSELASLDPAVADWEPRLALDGGEDGLEVYRRLFATVPSVLAAGGWLALEIDARRPNNTRELAAAAGWQRITIHDDLFGRPRYLIAQGESTK